MLKLIGRETYVDTLFLSISDFEFYQSLVALLRGETTKEEAGGRGVEAR